MSEFRILFFGDTVGSIGRKGLALGLPALREEYKPDLVIVNVENLAHGRGITPKTMMSLEELGIDAYTSGNHVWENPVGLPCFDDERWRDRLIRPANIKSGRPGRGIMLLERNGVRIAVCNLLGQILMKDEVTNPFHAFDAITQEVKPKADLLIVDFHAEATSEKEAFGHYADGRAAAVLGTHTHVPTADAKILPGGTAYVTDVGRVGAMDSVIGFEKKSAVLSYLTPDGGAYDLPKNGLVELNAVLLRLDPTTGRAVGLDRIRKIVES